MISISKVYPKEKDWAFVVTIADIDKGFRFGTEKGARRGRAKTLKELKLQGHKVLC